MGAGASPLLPASLGGWCTRSIPREPPASDFLTVYLLSRPPRHAPQWEATENKSSVVVYAVGAVVAVWLSSSVVSAINGVPLVRGGDPPLVFIG